MILLKSNFMSIQIDVSLLIRLDNQNTRVRKILRMIQEIDAYYIKRIMAQLIQFESIQSLLFNMNQQKDLRMQQHQSLQQCQVKQQSQNIFENDQEQMIFDYLTTNFHFNSKDYDQKDLDVDIVFKMEVPSSAYMNKKDTIKFSELFHDIPQPYEKVYQVIQEYIYFLTESDDREDQIPQNKNLKTRNLISLKYLQKIKSNFHKIKLQDKDETEELVIDCAEEHTNEMDTFTLQYNMITIILQQICGFHVKTYLFDQEQNDGSNKKIVFFLISQNMLNLMKLADKYKIQKQVDMTQIDFCINDPVDSSERPLKYNSNLQGYNQFNHKQIATHRRLKLKQLNPSQQIYDQAILEDEQVYKFKKYCQEEQIQIDLIFKDTERLVTQAEKQYIFACNRSKINQGCYLLLQAMKKKALVFDAIIRLNKKYNYPSYQYDESFFPFRLLSKNRPCFQKLRHILTYKSVIDSPYGNLCLFNRMEKIKLAYLCLGEYFKIQNLKKIGVQFFAINNDFERQGQITFECENQKGKGNPIGGGLNGKFLTNEWHMFIPFTSSIRTIRDYLGQKFAFQIMLKISLITFFAILLPFSIGGEFIIIYFFQGESSTYRFSLLEITFIVISLTIFIVTWKRKQKQFFKNYCQQQINNSFRGQYKGPFFRNCTTDKSNTYEYEKGITNKLINLLSYLGMIALLVCQGFCFYGIRMLIVAKYSTLPSTGTIFIILPHFIFYGIFFISNFIFYQKILHPLIIKIVGINNYPEKKQHQSQVRLFSYIFTFGIELVGPLFFMLIEPFNGTSCYAAQCIDQFVNYIYSRYAIIFLFISFKLINIIYYYCYQAMNSQKKLLHNDVKYKTYHDKLNFLLGFVRKQYQKKQIRFDLKEEGLSLYFVCIFSTIFPFCSVLAFGALYLEYMLKRIEILKVGRRPIPRRQDLISVQSLFQNILHLCIIVNSWMICFSYKFLEYDLSNLLQIFLSETTKDSILSFKIFVTAVLIVVLETISFLLKSLINRFTNNQLQNRKVNKYKEYLHKTQSKPLQKDANKEHFLPIKTIFRAFGMDELAKYKNSKVNFRKISRQSKIKNKNYNFAKKQHTENQVMSEKFKTPRNVPSLLQESNNVLSSRRDASHQNLQ